MTGMPSMITIAMREALHARGISDEEIFNLTPEGAHKILQTPDRSAVREFLTTIIAQARATTRDLPQPGLLQIFTVHPLDDGNAVPYRYALDDPNLLERMTADAVNASEAGHNVYIEGRTVRPGLKGKERGGYADIVAVFALVVDSDADKGVGWNPTVPVSLGVETSPDNAHHWLFFARAIDSQTAKAYGERLRAATNADSDTGNACQPYRVAGTVNYPNKKKLERGRIITWTRVLEFDPEVLWTPERFEAEFPVNGGGAANGKAKASPEEADIPADTMTVIRGDGLPIEKRGRAFFNVTIVLKERGFTIDGIVALFEKYPNGVASKYAGRLRHQVETVWAKLDKGGERPKATPTTITILSKADFLAGFVPPDYLVENILQRRFIYSLTAVTGHGKTALALLLARAIGCADSNARFGPHAAEKGRAAYFVGENPDDVRCRIIGDDAERNDNPDLDYIEFIPGVFDIGGLYEQLVAAADKLGGIDLVIVDTSAAYFLGDDEINNTQMGAHARMLRTLTTLPGGPCIVVLCHPIKHVTEPSQLVPRGGGAFLNEMDGNLTAWKHDENLVTLHHSADKWRGPGFEPITFKLEKVTTEKLVDRKGRQIPTVHAVAISEAEEKEQEARTEREEDELLSALAHNKPLSVADLARACGWLLPDSEPYKSKVQRVLKRLQDDRLVKRVRSKYRLTEEGRKAVGVDDDDDEVTETAEDRSGAAGSKKPFHPLRGMKQRPTVPCAWCEQTGDVYKFADGRLPRGQRHHADLHADCAEPFFTGQPKPKSKPKSEAAAGAF